MDERQPLRFTRRSFVGLAGIASLSALTGSMLAGCGGGEATAAKDAAAAIDYANWDSVLAAAKGQTVSWYGYGGDKMRNAWIEDVLAPALKEKYDITLDLVGMDINDILTQLSGEMQAGTKSGSIDFIWINGENFYSCKENGYLWGPFTGYLPNFNAYIDAENPEVTTDFGSPTEGFEAPYGKAQFQMWVDGGKITRTPTDPERFLEFCKANEGKVTYPEPGDFTGTAFISCLIAGVIGQEKFEQLSKLSKTDATAEKVREIIEPGLEYLRSLNPHLWQKGTTFPTDHATMATMYADGELVLDMGYGAPQSLVDDGALPASTKSFIFETGTVGNSNFMAIAANAAHKEAALVAINEVLSPEMQQSIYEKLTTITVLDMNRLSPDQKKLFDDVELKSTQILLDNLLEHRITEASGPAIPLIEQLWLDEVVSK